MAFDTSVNRVAQMVKSIATRVSYISGQVGTPTDGTASISDISDGTVHYFTVGYDALGSLPTDADWILG